MKKILISLSIIGVVGAIAIGATVALFNDTETSTGNIFTAGSIDLKVDHTRATYNGEACVGECTETGGELVLNGGFEAPDVPTDGWAIYPNGSLTSWNVESGAGLEIQDHAAGLPHGGNQLAELDSNNSSVISQTITTVAGQKYRLRFWYSPRPNRPAGDNTIGAVVQVVSNSAILVNATIGASSSGGQTTNWQEFTYDFTAVDASTKIKFSDLGTSNSYGGYLDDIGLKELSCSSHFPSGGTCTLWNDKDLSRGDTFWSFNDVKPGDSGTNIISLHASSNDAYACLITNNVIDAEDTVIDPEIKAGDNINSVVGELSQFIKIFAWEDANQNNSYEVGEIILLPVNSALTAKMNPAIALTASNTKNIGIAWCAGTQSLSGSTISCNGSSMGNIAQTDITYASVTAYAEQQRNNPNFNCANVVLPQPIN